MPESLRLLLFGRDNRVGRRLVVLVVAFSTAITLFISVIQLAVEYQGLRRAIDRQLDAIAVHVPTIAASVWSFDADQVQRAIDGLALLPDMAVIRVIPADAGKRWIAGRGLDGDSDSVVRRYPLTYQSRGQNMEIGTLEVVASLEGAYRQLGHLALSIVLANGLKTVLLVVFLIYLVRRLITVRLEAMAEKVRRLVPELLPLREVVEARPEPLPEGLGELGAVSWMLDRTAEDLATAAAAMRQANEDLERRVRERTHELESFSYSVSHDLRAPLRAIDGFSKILIEDHQQQLDEEGRRLLAVVRNNTARMGQLIDDILQFSRVGRQDLNLAPVDMASLVAAVVGDLQQAWAGRRVEWEIGPLPVVPGDASMLRQVMVNLLGNALKFTQRRDPAHIAITAEADGPDWRFCVRDNGVGFDMRYVDKLFGVFERLHSSEEFEGTGIGLAIVKQVVSRLGGRVWAEGRPDEGAAIFFTLGKTRT